MNKRLLLWKKMIRSNYQMNTYITCTCTCAWDHITAWHFIIKTLNAYFYPVPSTKNFTTYFLVICEIDVKSMQNEKDGSWICCKNELDNWLKVCINDDVQCSGTCCHTKYGGKYYEKFKLKVFNTQYSYLSDLNSKKCPIGDLKIRKKPSINTAKQP